MAKNTFEVRPVARYDTARYPSPWVEPTPAEGREEEKPGAVMFVMLVVLVLGLSVGMIGCFADYRSDWCDPGQVIQPNGSCGPDPNPDCDPGALKCEGDTLMTCTADEEWTSQACEAYCDAMYGIDAYSNGCDADATDPCGCVYDIVDGIDVQCDPGTVHCQDEQTVLVCDGINWNEKSCQDYCLETNGDFSVPTVCVDDSDPCGCYYDGIDGGMAWCDVGDQYCVDELTVATCIENGTSYNQQTCAEYCRETFGPDYYSHGCDEAAEDPCGCEYDIIDGDVAWCDPGSFMCLPDNRVSICNDDSMNWDEQACETYCQETHGVDWHSYGCDDQAAEPCACEYDLIGGVAAECTPGQIDCKDEGTLKICQDDWTTWEEKDCQVVCQETFGENSNATVCDATDPDNPCGCE